MLRESEIEGEEQEFIYVWRILELSYRVNPEIHPSYRFFVKRFPVLKYPLSPIELRHSIDNWPRTVLPSRFISFCRKSSPSCSPLCCSTRNATWRTSRGLSAGRFGFTESGLAKSQFRDCDLNGGLGFSVVP